MTSLVTRRHTWDSKGAVDFDVEASGLPSERVYYKNGKRVLTGDFDVDLLFFFGENAGDHDLAGDHSGFTHERGLPFDGSSLATRVRERFATNPSLHWDDALSIIVRGDARRSEALP